MNNNKTTEKKKTKNNLHKILLAALVTTKAFGGYWDFLLFIKELPSNDVGNFFFVLICLLK